jgi:hypothetical protein
MTRRLEPVLVLFAAATMGVAACAHAWSSPSPAVQAAQADGPALAPWSGSGGDLGIGQDPAPVTAFEAP